MVENLKRWGAEMRRRGARRVVALDETFFSVVDTEEKAYWLGFLLADGSAQKTAAGNYTLRVSLAARDVGHLAKLRTALGSDATIRKEPRRNAVSIRFCSKRLCDDLAALEVVPNKTGTHVTPRISADLLRHLYRGYFDGDGSLCRFKDSNNWYFSLVGSPVFTWEFTDWVSVALGLTTSCVVQRGPVTDIRYSGGQRVEQVMRLLYQDATVYLARKHEKYGELLGRRKSPGPAPAAPVRAW